MDNIQKLTDSELRIHRRSIQDEIDDLVKKSKQLQLALNIADIELDDRRKLDEYYKKHPDLMRVSLGDKLLMIMNVWHYMKKEVILVVDKIEPDWFGKADGIHVVGLKIKYSTEFNPSKVSQMRKDYLEAYGQ